MGCTACAQVCPSRAIEVTDAVVNGRGIRRLEVHWDICIFCGQCQANCPTTKGIVLSQEYDFATTKGGALLPQEIEKELLLCECCKEVVVPCEQYRWVAQMLGPLTFTNASLLLRYLEGCGLASCGQAPAGKKEGFLRSDRVTVLCPRCRREAVVKS